MPGSFSPAAIELKFKALLTMLHVEQNKNRLGYLSRSIRHYFTNPHRIYRLSNLKPCTLNAVGLLLIAKAFFISVVFLFALFAAAALETPGVDTFSPFNFFAVVLPIAFLVEATVIKPLLVVAFAHLILANVVGDTVTFLRILRFLLCLKAVVIVASAPICALTATAFGVTLFAGERSPEAIAIVPPTMICVTTAGFLGATSIYHGNFSRSRIVAISVIVGGGVFIFMTNSIVAQFYNSLL